MNISWTINVYPTVNVTEKNLIGPLWTGSKESTSHTIKSSITSMPSYPHGS